MKSYLLILALLTVIITGCKKDNELKKSVFIPDAEEPALPAYSEWGYNTFGAYYDRQIFVSSNDLVPSKVFSSDTAMQFSMEGELWHDDHGSFSKMSITFILKGFMPLQYEDLVALNDSIIDLKDNRCQMQIFNNSVKLPVNILSGKLYFKRVQNLSVDKQHIEAIISGYFEFQAVINNQPVTVSEGRFDFGVGSDNFYLNE